MLFGRKELSRVVGGGKFYCPECRCTTGYFLKQKRNSYAVLKIPLLPLDIIGQYVECNECGNSFRETILDCNPETSRAEFHPSMKRIMILMMLADGEIDDSEIESIRDIYTRVSGFQISKDEIIQEIDAAKKDDPRVQAYLRRVTPYLNNVGKVQVLKSAYYVAAADGVFQNEEETLMEEISKALDMEPAHYKNLISTLRNTEVKAFAGNQ